jgi:hypothetical protein
MTQSVLQKWIRISAMNNNNPTNRDLNQTEEEIFTYEVSDEALEAAWRPRTGAANTVGAFTASFLCCSIS